MKKVSILIFAIALFSSGCFLTDALEPGSEIIINSDITSDTLWIAEKTYIIDGDVQVQATLTIEAGTVIKFNSDDQMVIGPGTDPGEEGALIAVGTPADAENGILAKPITFTSSSSNPQKGSFVGLEFGPGALPTTVVRHAIIEYAGGWYANQGAVELNDSKGTVTMEDCIIRNSEKIGIELDSTSYFMSFRRNIITGCDSYPVKVSANRADTLGPVDGDKNTITSSGYGIQLTGNVTRDVTWYAQDVPYYILEDITAGSSNAGTPVDVTIEAGAVIKLGSDINLEFGDSSTFCNLTAIGTSLKPITFTSVAASPSAGDWSEIVLGDDLVSANLQYCDFSYGGGWYSNNGLLVIDADNLENITIENCDFSHSDEYGIYVGSGAEFNFNSFIHNNFSDIAEAPVSVPDTCDFIEDDFDDNNNTSPGVDTAVEIRN